MIALNRDGYGVAWLCLCAAKKGKVQPGVSSLDLSGCSLSPRRIFFVLDRLPNSVEGLKLGPSAVKGPALPLLRHFLEGVGGEEAGGGTPDTERLCLKSLSFADSALNSSEAEVIFSVLPPSLETLILKGNPLGLGAIRGLAERIKGGMMSSLLHLDLEGTRLNDEGLQILCGAVEGKSLKLETLNLSGNRLGVGGMEKLCSVLRVASLREMRVLLLRRCDLSDDAVERVVESMAGGDLPNLEMLDLEENFSCIGRYLCPLGWALRKGAVPRLRVLNLNRAFLPAADQEALSAFLGVLKLNTGECPPELHVHLDLSPFRFLDLDEEIVRVIGTGTLASLRTLILYLRSDEARVFFEEMVAASVPNPLERLDVSLDLVAHQSDEKEVLRLVSETIQMGRLDCMRKFQIRYFAETDELAEERKTAVLTALCIRQLPRLSELVLSGMLNQAGAEAVAQAVRGGHLSGLRNLSLARGSGTRALLEQVIGGVVESEKGLPLLETLELSEGGGGWSH